jgi:hypothetical protein
MNGMDVSIIIDERDRRRLPERLAAYKRACAPYIAEIVRIRSMVVPTYYMTIPGDGSPGEFSVLNDGLSSLDRERIAGIEALMDSLARSFGLTVSESPKG